MLHCLQLAAAARWMVEKNWAADCLQHRSSEAGLELRKLGKLLLCKLPSWHGTHLILFPAQAKSQSVQLASFGHPA